MASITLTLPNGATGQRVLDSYCSAQGYTGFLADGTTPQTKGEFVKADLIKFAKMVVAKYESQVAARSAETTALNDVEQNIIIT